MGQPERAPHGHRSVQLIWWQKPIRIYQARLAWMRYLMHSLDQQRVARLSAKQSRVTLAAGNWVRADQGWQVQKKATTGFSPIQEARAPRRVLWNPGLFGLPVQQCLHSPRLTLPFSGHFIFCSVLYFSGSIMKTEKALISLEKSKASGWVISSHLLRNL